MLGQRLLGARILRVEDPPFLRGSATFVSDVTRPGAVHLGIVRSSQASAVLRSVNLTHVRSIPGVVAAFASIDLPEDIRWGMMSPAPEALRRPVLAIDRVRFVGEAVAAVVAEDPYTLADAMEAIRVEYEPLPAVTSVVSAVEADAPLLFPELGSNVVMDGAPATSVAEALDYAPHVLRERYVTQRLSAAPMEANGVVAEWSNDELTVWAATQVPHFVRTDLGRLFKMPQARVRVIVPSVGGAFGSKQEWYPEMTLAVHAARVLGRPVSYSQTRTEAMVAMCHGRDQIQDVAVGYDDDGRILALDVRIDQNCGAYPTLLGMILPQITKGMASGCYRIPAVAVRARSVATNTTPVCPYRGAGRPEATFFIERIIERIADERGLDPNDVRRRNFVGPDEFPYQPAGEFAQAYDSGNFPACMDLLEETIGYRALRAEQARRRMTPSTTQLGIGVACFVDIGGGGPSAIYAGLGRETGGWEAATVRLLPDESAILLIGTAPQGQGHETTYAQIVADALGIAHASVRVIEGDTHAVTHGVGTNGDRSMAVGGSAVVLSAAKVVEQARTVAAHLLEIDPDELEFVDGRFVPAGVPGKAIGIGSVARAAAYQAIDLPAGIEPGLQATTFWEPAALVVASGAYCCVVEVDTETGGVEVLRFVAVDDAGNVLNPLLAEGQVHGGVAQGIGQALFEEVAYNGEGQPLNPNFAGYLIPSAPEVPFINTEFVVTPSPINPLGAKGIGESGAVGAPAAVVNAVVDALSHLGVHELRMPVTPEQVLRAIGTIA